MKKNNAFFVLIVSIFLSSCCNLCYKTQVTEPLIISKLGEPISIDTMTIVNPVDYYEESWIIRYYNLESKQSDLDSLYDGSQLIHILAKDGKKVIYLKSIFYKQRQYHFE
jgi:hypothetical protein